MARFKYYTIYRCRNCGDYVRVHGKLASKLVLPRGMPMCCTRPKLLREREVLISEYNSKEPLGEMEPEDVPSKQKRLVEYSKD